MCHEMLLATSERLLESAETSTRESLSILPTFGRADFLTFIRTGFLYMFIARVRCSGLLERERKMRRVSFLKSFIKGGRRIHVHSRSEIQAIVHRSTQQKDKVRRPSSQNPSTLKLRHEVLSDPRLSSSSRYRQHSHCNTNTSALLLLAFSFLTKAHLRATRE